MKRPPLVEVEWLDHAFFLCGDDPYLFRRWTTGYVVKETKKAIILAATWDETGPAECTILGMALVKKVRKL